MSRIPPPRSTWHKVRAGLYELQTSLTGRYVAEFDPQRKMWGLRYEGGYSSHVHYFFTLRRAKDYVAGIGDGS
jgi:hypothetical protein